MLSVTKEIVDTKQLGGITPFQYRQKAHETSKHTLPAVKQPDGGMLAVFF